MALKETEERIFWEEVHAAFARIANDPKESAEFYGEFEAWDRGTASDFKDEKW